MEQKIERPKFLSEEEAKEKMDNDAENDIVKCLCLEIDEIKHTARKKVLDVINKHKNGEAVEVYLVESVSSEFDWIEVLSKDLSKNAAFQNNLEYFENEILESAKDLKSALVSNADLLKDFLIEEEKSKPLSDDVVSGRITIYHKEKIHEYFVDDIIFKIEAILSVCFRKVVVIGGITESEIEKPSLPKLISMLTAAGLFETKQMKRLSDEQKAKVLAKGLGLDPEDSNKTRGIKGNIRNRENTVELGNYTAYKHLNKFKEYISSL